MEGTNLISFDLSLSLFLSLSLSSSSSPSSSVYWREIMQQKCRKNPAKPHSRAIIWISPTLLLHNFPTARTIFISDGKYCVYRPIWHRLVSIVQSWANSVKLWYFSLILKLRPSGNTYGEHRSMADSIFSIIKYSLPMRERRICRTYKWRTKNNNSWKMQDNGKMTDLGISQVCKRRHCAN